MRPAPFAVTLMVAAAAAVLCAPAVAFADDAPVPSTRDETSHPPVDCGTGVLEILTIHLEAFQRPDGTWGWGQVGEDAVQAPPWTGGGVNADCPWWVLSDDTGYWVDSRETEPVAFDSDGEETTPPDDQSDDEPAVATIAAGGIVWKLGING